MFDKFGPLTYEELNKTAEGLKMEGDIESLILLAEENGLEKEDAEDYADEVVDTFTTPVEAARNPEKSLAECLGKLVAEASRTRYKLPDEIADAAGIPTVYMGDISKERAREIIKAYYGGDKL